MKTNTPNNLQSKLEAITDDLCQRAESLDFQVGNALEYSISHAARHLSTHAYMDEGQGYLVAGAMAAARLEWLLDTARQSISGMFAEHEIVALLSCFQGNLFYPQGSASMAGALCDDRGIEPDEYKHSEIGPLVEKLLTLEPVQSLALADALEQVWYVDMQEGRTVASAFKRLGIDLL